MIKSLIEDLYLTDFAPVSPGADKAIARLKEELDFQILEIPSGTEKNGWLVPESWHYSKAEIRRNGKLIYDGRKHPLGVAGYSKSFKGEVSLEELKKHVFFSQEQPEAIVFHCTHYFRTQDRDWGFCMPKILFDKLTPGEYSIELIAESKPGTMKILEYTLRGMSGEGILLHAHNCHPGQANDDLSGVAVGIEFLKRMAKIKDRHYSYTLVVSAEIFGSYYWLDSLSEERLKNIRGAIMLKSVGNDNSLKLQCSYEGNNFLDLAGRNALRSINPHFVQGPFRRVYGNDETVFEAPGYEIPSISLTRFPFPQYHTSLDTPTIVSEAKLEETVLCLEKIAFIMQENCRMQRKFKGLLALSHPRYNLYKPHWNPAEKTSLQRSDPNHWHFLMIDMFRDFDSNITMLEVAERHQLPFDEVHEYLTQLKQTGAIEFIPSDTNLPNVLPFSKRRVKHAP